MSDKSTHVIIELYPPNVDDCLDHCDKVAARASELGWPEPYSMGTYPGGDRLTVELVWVIEAVEIDSAAGVIATLREEFDVCDVRTFRDDDLVTVATLDNGVEVIIENATSIRLFGPDEVEPGHESDPWADNYSHIRHLNVETFHFTADQAVRLALGILDAVRTVREA